MFLAFIIAVLEGVGRFVTPPLRRAAAFQLVARRRSAASRGNRIQ